MIKNKNIIHKKKFNTNLIIVFYSFSIFSGVITNFAALIPDTIKYFFYATSIFFGYSGLIFYFLTLRKTQNSDIILILWLALFFYMILIGLVRSDFYQSSFDLGIFLATDLRYVMYMAIGFSLANTDYIYYYHKIMIILGYISIVSSLIGLLTFNLDISLLQAGARLGLWELPYFFWWISIGVFAYLYSYSRLTGKNKVVGYGSLIGYALLGFLFVKRSALVNVIFIIIVVEFFRSQRKPFIKNAKSNHIIMLVSALLLVVVIVIILGLKAEKFYTIIQGILNSYKSRFFEGGNYFEYDRAIESKLYFENISLFDFVSGQGVGFYFYTNRVLNALHTGISNTFYKGGIFYFVFILAIFFQTVKTFINRRNITTYKLISLCVSISFLMSMLYEMSWTYTIVIVGYATSLGYIFNSERNY